MVWCSPLWAADAASITRSVPIAALGHGTQLAFWSTRVPPFHCWCSMAESLAVKGLQRFRNTKNTKNTGFLRGTDMHTLTRAPSRRLASSGERPCALW